MLKQKFNELSEQFKSVEERLLSIIRSEARTEKEVRSARQELDAAKREFYDQVDPILDEYLDAQALPVLEEV